MKRPDRTYSDNSAVLWEGPSAYNGEPIVAIVTGLTTPSSNVKTGDMVQLWIFSQSAKPHEVAKAGKDDSTCGACPFKPTSSESDVKCYVTLWQMSALWSKYDRGDMQHVSPSELSDWLGRTGLNLRLGAYGDPGMLPISVLEAAVTGAKRHTSYTHQWQWASPELATTTMASVETVDDMREANMKGYRTYRVIQDTSEIQAGEIQCPEQSQGRDKVTCNTCGLCNGASGAKNIAIVAI